MTETSVSDATFYSAIDQLANKKSRRQPTYDARLQAEVIANDSDSAVPVAAAVKNTSTMKIAARNGKTVGVKRTAKLPGELNATSRPGEENAKRAALERLVRERATLLAARNNHGKK
jgi:hypothetical protein